jgi:hypothetical protein
MLHGVGSPAAKRRYRGMIQVNEMLADGEFLAIFLRNVETHLFDYTSRDR